MRYFPTGVNNKNETNKDSHFIPRTEKGELPKTLNFKNTNKNYKFKSKPSGLQHY
jgi:hypothetical protein